MIKVETGSFPNSQNVFITDLKHILSAAKFYIVAEGSVSRCWHTNVSGNDSLGI